MHEKVSDGHGKRQRRAQNLHNANTNDLQTKFMLTDYVLIRWHKKRGHNYSLRGEDPGA